MDASEPSGSNVQGMYQYRTLDEIKYDSEKRLPPSSAGQVTITSSAKNFPNSGHRLFKSRVNPLDPSDASVREWVLRREGIEEQLDEIVEWYNDKTLFAHTTFEAQKEDFKSEIDELVASYRDVTLEFPFGRIHHNWVEN